MLSLWIYPEKEHNSSTTLLQKQIGWILPSFTMNPQNVPLTNSSFCSISSLILFCLFCRLGSDDNQFETSMANSGCEVHRFDPSIKSAHIQEGRHLWYHRLSIDWRDPNPAIAAHKLHSNTKKLGTIMNEFGHQKVRTSVSGFLLQGWVLGMLQMFVLGVSEGQTLSQDIS